MDLSREEERLREARAGTPERQWGHVTGEPFGSVDAGRVARGVHE